MEGNCLSSRKIVEAICEQARHFIIGTHPLGSSHHVNIFRYSEEAERKTTIRADKT